MVTVFYLVHCSGVTPSSARYSVWDQSGKTGSLPPIFSLPDNKLAFEDLFYLSSFQHKNILYLSEYFYK